MKTNIIIVIFCCSILATAMVSATPLAFNGVIIGDSIASGRCGTYIQPMSNATNSTVFFNSSYTNQWGSLAYFLEQNSTFGVNSTHSNYARYGARSDLVLGKFYRTGLGYDIPMYDNMPNATQYLTLGVKPNVIIIDVGINDVAYNTSLPTIKNNIYNMVVQAEQHRVPCVVLTLNPPGDFAFAVTNVTDINTWMKSNLTQPNVKVYDAYTFFDNGAGVVKADYDWGDGMHVVPEGYEDIAPFIQDAINEVVASYKTMYSNPRLIISPDDVAVFNWNYSVISDETKLQTWTNNGISRVSPTVYKNYNGSAEFNTSTSFISSTNTSGFKFLHDGVTPWTIKTWVKIPIGGLGSSRFFLDTGGTSTSFRGVTLAVTSSRAPYIQMSNGSGVAYLIADSFGTTAQYPDDGNWNYIEYSFNGTYYNAAINGSFVGSVIKPLTGYSSSDSTRVYIGGRGSGTSYTNGFLDDLVISKKLNDNMYVIPFGEYFTPVKPNFSKNLTSGVAPVPLTITDTTLYSDTTTSYFLNYGDGTTTSIKNQTYIHTYNSPGIYEINLTTTDSSGNVSKKADMFTVYLTSPESLTANFTASPLESAINENVTFTDTTTDSPTMWLWGFGDGTNSSEQNPVHAYSSTGYKSVVLTVWNATATNSITYPNYINVSASGVGGFTQQDIELTPSYFLLLNVVDSSGIAIAGATVTTSDGQTNTTVVGKTTTWHPYSIVTVCAGASGYDGQCAQYTMDQNREETIQLDVESKYNPDFQSYPHYVTFHVKEGFGEPVTDVEVSVIGVSTSTGNWDFIMQLLGLPLDEIPINGTFMNQTTDSLGRATFFLIPTGKYNITFTKTGYTITPMVLVPQDENYIVFATEAEDLYFRDGSDEISTVNISITTTAISDTVSFINITYNDTSLKTTGGTIQVLQKSDQPWSANTVMATWPVTGNSFSNGTAITHTQQVSGYVSANISHSEFGYVARSYPYAFNSVPVKFLGFGQEIALLVALGMMVFTLMLAGAAHVRPILFLVGIEGWIFDAMHWFDSLIDRGVPHESIWIALTILTIMAILANFEVRKKKEKY